MSEDRPSGGAREHAAESGNAVSFRYRYCPLEGGEPIEVTACATCPHNPPAPFKICFAPKPARPRRRGFWDREEPPG